MKCDYKILKDKIEDYYSDIITQIELKKWLKEVYSYFLTKGFLMVENLCIYPLLNYLVNAMDNAENNCEIELCHTEIKYIYNILCGCEDKIFFYRMSLPWEYPIMRNYKNVYEEYLRLQAYIKGHIYGGSDNYNEIQQQIDTLKSIEKTNTVLDMLGYKILSLAEHIFSDHERSVIETNILNLYPNISCDRADEKLLSLLFSYLDCIIGEKPLIVESAYICGSVGINTNYDS